MLEKENAPQEVAGSEQGNTGQVNNSTLRCGLTIVRIARLVQLIDRVNRECNVSATLSIGKYSAEMHVSFLDRQKYIVFETNKLNYTERVQDANMEMAERLLKSLLTISEIEPLLVGKEMAV